MTEPREIKPEDVRTGDRIRVTDVAEGVAHRWTGESDYRIAYDDGQCASFSIRVTEGRTITLLDRPLPPIPEDVGTIIRKRVGGAVYERVLDGWQWSGTGRHLLRPPTREHFDVLWPKETP